MERGNNGDHPITNGSFAKGTPKKGTPFQREQTDRTHNTGGEGRRSADVLESVRRRNLKSWKGRKGKTPK